MRTPSRLRCRRLLLCLAVSVGLVAAACGNSGDDEASGTEETTTSAAAAPSSGGAAGSITGVPGVTDDEIRFSSFGTISNNPLGTCVLDCYDQGIKAYFAYRNGEGGVHGRKMVLTTELDDQLSQNKQRALEIVSANDTFASFSAAQLGNGWQDVTNAGMPLYVWNISPADATGDAIFGNPQSTICLECPRQINGYAVKLEKAKKIGIVGYGVSENSKLAAGATRDAIEQYSDDIGGAKVAYFNDDLPFGLPNGLGPEVTAMKDKGVDLIFGCLDLNGMKTLAQELERQDMADVHMVHANTYDQEFVEEAGDLFEGDYRPDRVPTLRGRHRRQRPRPVQAVDGEAGQRPVELAMVGWIDARTAYDGLIAAGPQFDRAKVIEATNQTFDRATPPVA